MLESVELSNHWTITLWNFEYSSQSINHEKLHCRNYCILIKRHIFHVYVYHFSPDFCQQRKEAMLLRQMGPLSESGSGRWITWNWPPPSTYRYVHQNVKLTTPVNIQVCTPERETDHPRQHTGMYTRTWNWPPPPPPFSCIDCH